MAGPSIAGEVRLEGKPLGGAYVRLAGPSGEFVSEQYTRNEGRFRFHVAPGRWTLEVRAAGSRSETRAVDVEDGETELSIEVAPA